MFGLVKKLLGKKEVRPTTTTPAAAPSVKSKKSQDTIQVSKGSVAARAGAGPAGAKAPAGKAAPGAETVSLSLMGVVNLLPADLRPARAIGEFASVQISFPLRPILEQLTQGCVRVPFGEIRRLAPPEFFSVGSEANDKLVELPLQEILQQVQSHPYLATSKNRKTVSVPDEVTSLFSARTSAAGPAKRPGGKGNTTSFFAREKTATPAPAAPAIRAPEVAKSSPPAAAPAAAPVPTKQPASPPPISVAARTPAPAASTEEVAPAAVDPTPPVSKPIAAPKLAAAFQQPSATPGTRAPAPQAPSATPSGEVVTLPLSKICGAWPNEIQGEIVSWKLEHASVALPAEEIIASLKSGKVQVTWSRVIASLVNGAGAGRSSAHGAAVLDLPLQSVAPAFLAQRRTPGRSALPTVDASIPDLFHAATAAEAAAKAREAAAAAAPAPVAAGPMTTASGSLTLAVPLAMVDDAWQDSLKAEIARCQIPGVKLELPVDEVNRALKAGKIEYPWRQLRAWMVPALPPETGAEHAEKLIALPLKVIAPLFLGQVKALKGVKKGDAGSDIPDLFTAAAPSGQGAEIAVGEPSAAKPAAVDASAPKPSGEASAAPSGFSTTQFFRKPPADLGELFGQPGKRSWTPQEIVQNTTRIRGVTGAVIAMQDGLLVAAQLPSPWKAEATAAFLPQIYSRLTQFLKELNTGELTSATLATPSGTLVVFNAGIIYFAVIGKVDETVPLAPVKMIVNELSRHSK